MKMGKRDHILFYTLIGAGYLLFCSVLPSVLAIAGVENIGGDVNVYYGVLSFVIGLVYVAGLFRMQKEPIQITANWSGKGLIEAVITACILFTVINFVVSPGLSLLFPVSAQNYDANVTDMMTTPMVTFFQVVIAAPLFEELIFRGFILKRALRIWPAFLAVCITAILFGVLHMSIVQGISAAAAGVVLCLFYVRRKSVGLNILAHSIYNGMVFGMAWVLQGLK